MAASSCIAGSRRTTARSSRGNRVERIAARNGGTGQNGNGINIFRADGVIVVWQYRLRLRLLGDPRQQLEQSADRRKHLLALRRDRALCRIRLRGRGDQRQHRRRRGQRHLDRQFQRRRPRCSLLGQPRAQSVDRRPLPCRRAGLRRRHQRRGRHSGHRQHDRERAALRHRASAGGLTCATSWRPATSSATPAPASPSPWSKAPGRR